MTFTVEQIEKTATRVAELADAIPKGNMSEFTMRVPAEPDRDADIVLADAAQQLIDYAAMKRREAEDKVIVIQDGRVTTEGLVLAAAIYMGAVKDIFALRQDGPPLNERNVTKDYESMRAFDHLNAATVAMKQAIALHTSPPSQPSTGVPADVREAISTIACVANYKPAQFVTDAIRVIDTWLAAAPRSP